MQRFAIFGTVTLGIAALLSPALATAAQAATAPVVIHEIYYNSPGSDHGSNASLNAEWVQLHNRTAHRVTLTHWTLRDAAHHVYTFGSYTIKAHGYVKIHTGKGHNTQTNRYWGKSWYVWNNTGDTATVENASGVRQSRCSYSDPDENRAYKIC
jgi:Lamin Tail Domain